RRDQGESMFARQLATQLLAVLFVPVIKDDVCTIAASGSHLRCRGIAGHYDSRRYPQQFGGKRDRLGVVAGRKGRDTPPALPGIESGQRVERSAELEGPGTLEVLALEEDLGAQLLVRSARSQDRCAVRFVLEPLGSRDYIGIRWQIHSR